MTMKRGFINRQKELAFLEKEYSREGFRFVPIYGRRRIGKTELVKQFIKNKKGIYFLADTVDEKDQLKFLGRSVGEFFADFVIEEGGFSDWYSFFKYLQVKSAVSREKIVLVIDEFPYLAQANPAISSIFQKGIDEYLKETNIFLILLGSSVGMMEKEVLFYKAPLYGRRSGSLKMGEMSFFEIKDFFPGRGVEEWVDIYTACGMVPGYLDRYGDYEGFEDFLLRGVFDKSGFFYEEAEMALREDFYEPRTYYSILRAIALGKTRLAEIMNETGLDRSKIAKYLKVLQDLLIVEREVPVTEPQPERSKKGLFFIRDRYLNFWFRFVLGNKSYVEIGSFDRLFPVVREQIRAYQGFVFEFICKQYMLENIGRYGFDTIGRWWDRSEEIDLLAVDNEAREFIAAECKYQNKKVGIEVLSTLKEKVNRIEWRRSFKLRKVILFSRSGFTSGLEAAALEAGNVELVALEDMVK